MEEDATGQQDLLEFLYSCPVGLVEIDARGDIGLVNAHAMKHLLPIAGRRGVANLFAALEGCAPELRNMWEAFAPPAGAVCEGHRVAVDLGEGRDGPDPRMVSLTLVRLRPDRGILTLADVSAQAAQERRLKQAETWFAALIGEVNHYAVLTLTQEGVVDAINATFTQQTGHACADVAGKPLNEVLADDLSGGCPHLAEQLRTARRDGWSLDERWQERKDGSRYWCQRLFAARMSEGGERLAGYSVVLRDVTRQGADTSELRRLLTLDHLTGAANRGHFRQALEREQGSWRAEQRPTSLLLIDVDHFKAVNDAHGHPAGDQVLRQLTATCKGLIRSGDLFARIGGEEFAVLLPGTPLHDALATAEKLRAAIGGMAVDAAVGRIAVTASFGCAELAETTGSVEALIALADERLYRAKRGGRDRVCGPELLAAA